MYQYCLGGVLEWGSAVEWKWSELEILGRNVYPMLAGMKICILARMRRVLRTIFGPMRVQLPTSPLAVLRCGERFGAGIKTQWVHQYELPAFLEWGSAVEWNGPEIEILARHFYLMLTSMTFCVLARMRRVLRTIGNAFEIVIQTSDSCSACQTMQICIRDMVGSTLRIQAKMQIFMPGNIH